MALVDTKKMFEMAYKNGYAVGAFNVNNMEITQGIVAAVAEEKSPLILQISRGARSYASMSYLKAIIDVAVAETRISRSVCTLITGTHSKPASSAWTMDSPP